MTRACCGEALLPKNTVFLGRVGLGAVLFRLICVLGALEREGLGGSSFFVVLWIPCGPSPGAAGDSRGGHLLSVSLGAFGWASSSTSPA